jgi:hypothetical protein
LGGSWELVAKSSPSPTTFGISGVNAYLRDINNDAVIEGPRATVNGATEAGFKIQNNVFHPASPPAPAFREILVAQLPLFPRPASSEENLFYGVGTLTNGAPNYPGKPVGSNSIGPAFTSLTSPQDIPWATGDALADPAWDTAARLLSGTFSPGVTPSFFTGSTGNVFTTVPATNDALGNEIAASAVTGIVRIVPAVVPPPNSADYNHDGIVDGGDYVVWRKTQGLPAVPPGSGADGVPDGTINILDYNLWRSHYGNPSGAGAGGNLTTNNVPEPTGCVLLTIGALLAVAARRGRLQS